MGKWDTIKNVLVFLGFGYWTYKEVIPVRTHNSNSSARAGGASDNFDWLRLIYFWRQTALCHGGTYECETGNLNVVAEVHLMCDFSG